MNCVVPCCQNCDALNTFQYVDLASRLDLHNYYWLQLEWNRQYIEIYVHFTREQELSNSTKELHDIFLEYFLFAILA